MSKVKITKDSSRERPEEIVVFLHCKMCLEELPVGTSPKDFARLSVGYTEEGAIQVWCNRHEKNVALYSMSDEEVH